MDIKIANRLQELRKKHGLSQEELADKLNVSRQAVSKWERGDASPDTDNLIALAKIYNISIDELIKYEVKKGHNNEEIIVQNSDDKNKNEIKNESELTPKQKLITGVVSGVTVFAATIIYLIVGFCFNLWHPTWLVFMLLPVIASLTDSIIKKNCSNFAFPVMITMVYLVVGFLTDLWHPCWVMFLTIPVYYLICDIVNQSKNKENKIK